jgi:hypothetical protein
MSFDNSFAGYSPNPVPPIPDVEKNFENRCRNAFESIPSPALLHNSTYLAGIKLIYRS